MNPSPEKVRPYQKAISEFDPESGTIDQLKTQLRALHEQGHDVNSDVDAHGRTALYYAAANIAKLNDEIITLLIELGANPNVPTDNNLSPIGRYVYQTDLANNPTSERLSHVIQLFQQEAAIQKLISEKRFDEIFERLNLSRIAVSDSVLSNATDINSFIKNVFDYNNRVTGIIDFFKNNSGVFVSVYKRTLPDSVREPLDDFLSKLHALVPEEIFRSYIVGSFNPAAGRMNGLEYGITLDIDEKLRQMPALLTLLEQEQQQLEKLFADIKSHTAAAESSSSHEWLKQPAASEPLDISFFSVGKTEEDSDLDDEADLSQNPKTP